MRRIGLRTAALTAFAAALTGPVGAQATGTVAGQVTIKERPGEVTEDLGNVVVYLEPVGATARPKAPGPTNSVTILKRRQFEPRVRVVPQGSTVAFKNADPFSHNVFSKMNGGFDTGVYGRDKTRDNTFADTGVYPLYCNIHPRMTAFVITLATPYFAQAGGDGRFAIERIPAGTYKLRVWHDRVGEPKDTIVTVPSLALMRMTVNLDATAFRFVQHKNKFGQDYTSASGDRY